MLNHSVVLKFNNVEMLKSLWKLLKTPAAGTCAKRQNCLRQPCQFAQEKNIDSKKQNIIIKLARGRAGLGPQQENRKDLNNGEHRD